LIGLPVDSGGLRRPHAARPTPWSVVRSMRRITHRPFRFRVMIYPVFNDVKQKQVLARARRAPLHARRLALGSRVEIQRATLGKGLSVSAFPLDVPV
jgi:hypothetical protein